MATRLNPSNFGYQNFYSSTLTGDITSGTLTIGLATVPTPSSGILVIEPDSTTNREVIVYTSKGASTITCPSDGRGYSGTSASAHLTGSTVIMAPVDKWFTSLASGELSTDPIRTEGWFDFVASGMVWSGDSYASTRNASMTSGVMYINGRRLTASLVTSRSFTASKDTYIDASDNGDGTVLLTYTEVANNAASPALAANNVRVGIIVTGASSIANVGSVNQGEENKVVPTVTGTEYMTVTDSLGNLICPRDPNRKLLGYRQITANVTTTDSSGAQVTGLRVPVIVPTGRKVKISVFTPSLEVVTAGTPQTQIWDGTVGSGTQLQLGNGNVNVAMASHIEATQTPSTSNKTYNAGLRSTGGNTATFTAGAAFPGYIKVELV